MPKTDDYSTFSIRIPKEIADQLAVRARILRRSRNAEVLVLITQALDYSVAQDIQMQQDMMKRNHPELNLPADSPESS